MNVVSMHLVFIILVDARYAITERCTADPNRRSGNQTERS